MRDVSIVVRATWDEDAKVWVATSDDIDGLAVECETFEGWRGRVLAAVADLIEIKQPGIKKQF